VAATTRRSKTGRRLLALGAMLALGAGPSAAETLDSALARAYAGNPGLNSQRAGVRAVDENVAVAKSGYRPTVAGVADIGVAYRSGQFSGTQNLEQTLVPRSAGLQVTQNLFNGYQTDNRTRQAESQVIGARESLSNAEMTTLFNGAQSYMNVLRDTATLELQRNNVEVLEEQLRQTRDRFNVGEVTRTDVAQAEARLAGARSQASLAEANLRASIAVYRQVIGVEPRQLAPGRPLDRYVPGNLGAAVDIGLREHPQILAALHAVDVAESQVKVLEGALAPQVNVVGAVTQAYDQTFANTQSLSASIVGRLTVPIYEGGQVYAQIRQAKETAGQRRIEAETTRDAVRAAVVASWGQLEAAKAQVIASQAQVQANEVALNGVREEARVGQRTTLDVLNAQQELLVSRVNLIVAQRDRVVSSYSVVQSVGRLTTRFLNLNVAQYSPKEHFDQVKDLWFGARTPDGR
jgi:outer membrane protein